MLELPVVNPISCKINCASSCSRKYIHLNQLVPTLALNIPGDGNCLFSTLSYIITGSTSYNYRMRKIIITDNIQSTPVITKSDITKYLLITKSFNGPEILLSYYIIKTSVTTKWI